MNAQANGDEIDDTLQVVSEYFGVSVERLQSQSRAGEVLHARRAGLFLAQEVSGATPTKIGQRFGGRDYTLVLLAHRSQRALADRDERHAQLLAELKRRYAALRRVRT